MPIDRHERNAYSNFKDCVDDSPAGTNNEAKALADCINSLFTEFRHSLQSLGLKVDNCDPAFDLEAAMYHYARLSNPDAPLFLEAEQYGQTGNIRRDPSKTRSPSV